MAYVLNICPTGSPMSRTRFGLTVGYMAVDTSYLNPDIVRPSNIDRYRVGL